MSYNPFLFLKSYKERLDEFNCVLTDNLKARQVTEGWSNYLYLTIEPVGWKAIWKISRGLCADYKITYPCTVIVVVEHVNFKDLSCMVAVVEVDNDSIHLPDKLDDVPLIELHPTQEQDHSSALAMKETASVIDNLRFFYHNLWMPWDLEFDEDIPWVDAHLEGRLQLHFLMLESQLPEEIVDNVRKLATEGRQTLERMEDLLDTEDETELSPSQQLEYTELHNRLSHLKNEYVIYEKTHLLNALLERHRSEQDPKPLSTLVLSTTTCEQLQNVICTSLPAETKQKQIRVVPTLHEALMKTPQGGNVYLCRGEHMFQRLASFKTGGVITGLEPGVVLRGDTSEDDCATVDLLKGCLMMNHLTLRMSLTWIIMKVRPDGEVHLADVVIDGAAGTYGIDVYNGAILSAVDCTFNNCQTALVCYPNSKVTLTRCKFTDNNVAIELREGCQLSMTDCTISGSLICGVKVGQSPTTVKKGFNLPLTIDTLNSLSQLKEAGTICVNNIVDISFSEPTTADLANGDSAEVQGKTMDFTI